MRNHARMIATLTAAGALLALPAAGLAAKGGNSATAKAKVTAKAKATAKAKSCAKTTNVGYQVGGTLVSVDANTVVMSVTSANAHARRSGELEDQNTTKKGLQAKGAPVTIALTGSDTFTLRLKGYEGADTPSAGDKVKVSGKIAVTKKRCAATGTSTADRYAAPDIKTVTISDRDADA